ncbi:MAG TPA: cytochrome c [Coleofasciculaceae cyanobacterium]
MALSLSQWFQPLDPYMQSVLELQGDRDRGRAIFSMNCAVCHGADGTGYVGPSLVGVSNRKSQVALIEQVISGKTPPMPQFQPAPRDMADLLCYLETL